MSNIPPPGAGYDSYGYSGALHGYIGVGGDPFASYGSGDEYSSPEIQSYRQQLQAYYQNLLMVFQQMQAGDPRRAQVQKYMMMAQQYATQVGLQLQQMPANFGSNWDPTTGQMGPQGPQGPRFPVAYQDPSHIVSEDGQRVTYEGSAASASSLGMRQIDFYQKNATLIIPSNATVSNITREGNDIKVTLRFSDGSSQTLVYHNAQRPGFTLTVQAADPTQVTKDATLGDLNSRVNVQEMGAASQAAQGTPPDATDSTTRTWNTHDSVDYTVTAGSETDKIYADTVNITLPDRSHTAYVTKVDDHKYVIEIKDANGNVVRRIETYQTDRLTFQGVDAENFFFKDTNKTPADADFKAWSDSSHSTDTQLSVGGQGGSPTAQGALNPTHPEDAAPDEVQGNTATYNSPTQNNPLEINTYFDDNVTTHNITTPNEVVIHTSSYSDTVVITKVGDKYKIEVKKNGGTPVETYFVDGPPSKITIDALPAKISGAAANDPIIQKGLSGSGTQYPATVTNLTNWLKSNGVPTITEAQIMQAAQAAGLDTNQLAFPTLPPSQAMLNFLKQVDPALNAYLSNTNAIKTDHVARGQARDRILALLRVIYPSTTFTAGTPNNSVSPFNASDDIYIGTEGYDIFNNSTGGVRFAAWGQSGSGADA